MNLEQRQSTWKPKDDIKKSIKSDDLYKYLTIFDGDVSLCNKAVVRDEIARASWNKHLIMPLGHEETVYIHPDQSDVKEGYTKVIHSDKRCVSTFSNICFMFLSAPSV